MSARAPIVAFILGTAAALGTAATAQVELEAQKPVLVNLAAPDNALSPAAAAPSQPRATHRPLLAAEFGSRPWQDELAHLLSPGLAIHVRDLRTGRVLMDHHGARPQNPASGLKLLTAATAVEVLGATYRFETTVARHDDTLYLIGGGDPSLLLDNLYALAGTLSEADLDGVTRIAVDDSAFDHARFGPGYDIAGDDAYLAPSGALSMQFNTLEVVVTPGEFGSPATVRVDPPSSAVRIEGRVMTGSRAGVSVSTQDADGITIVSVAGGIPAGAATRVIRRRVGDPGMFVAGAFADVVAKQRGEAALPIRRDVAPNDAHELATHRSRPLPQVLRAALRFSNNFTAEQTLRTLAHEVTGEPGSFDAGVQVVRDHWARIGGTSSEFHFVNGSGLFRDGRATARTMVDVVSRIAAPDAPAATLMPALAPAGGEGTMAHRLPFAGTRLRAKTGTMNGVSTLSGVVASENGDLRIGFSILMANVQDSSQARRTQDRLVRELLRLTDRTAASPSR